MKSEWSLWHNSFSCKLKNKTNFCRKKRFTKFDNVNKKLVFYTNEIRQYHVEMNEI